MEKKSQFRKNAIIVYVCGIIAFYLATGLMNDHINILQPYYAEQYGWSATAITMPITVASYVAIPMAVVFGLLFHKFSIRLLMGGCTMVLGLATLALGMAGDHILVYAVSLFLVRLMVLPLALGVQSLCTNWFIESRGRALGIVTMGGPLCSATLVALLTMAVGSALGFTGTYRIMGVIVIVVGVLFLCLLKDCPEQCGLHPDGASAAPASRKEGETARLSQILSNGNTYLIVLSVGLLWLSLVGTMAFFVPRMAATGTEPEVYLTTLTVSALLGVVLSYLVGIVDDKFGTPAAFLLVCCFNLMAVAALLLMTKDNIALIVCAALGIAGMTGGLQNIQPSIISYIYGRDSFGAVNGWLYSFESVLSAFGVIYMSAILDRTGMLDAAYVGMIAMTAVAAVCVLLLWKRNPRPHDAEV